MSAHEFPLAHVGPSAYAGKPGGPRDPATPGGYCLARCYCRECPQYQPLPDPIAFAMPERTQPPHSPKEVRA